VIAIPIALGLFGYWVLYAGLKGSTLADAYACRAQQQQTPTNQGGPGTINVTPVPGGPTLGIATDCTIRAGDTKLPIPGSRGGYMIWRPLGSGILGQVNGQLVGPCPGG
jgi:hypothetical protein